MTDARLPQIIQGGMGVAVSSWKLAHKVARAGELGVVSGTGLDIVVARRLQDGDVDGDLRRAFAAFPVPEVAQEILGHYFVEGGREPGQPYIAIPRPSLTETLRAQRLQVVANFAEVWLAKEGHDGIVGVNFLEKIQSPTPWTAYGAMLAGVDCVLMGAGIPAHIPALLNQLAAHEVASLPVDVADSLPDETWAVTIDPREVMAGVDLPPLRRPTFLAIVANHVLAQYLARDEVTRPDGFVVEAPTAGGHNAPPRGKLVLDDDGQPVYGPRDVIDPAKFADLGLPFWLAGSWGAPARLQEALALGAAGIQVGTLFAMSEDSGFRPDIRERLRTSLIDGTLTTRTDPLASPTGFPFKVAQLPGTLSDLGLRAERPKVCDLGHLRTPFRKADGRLDYRCASEPDHMFTRKGGGDDEITGRACLCNALVASAGLPQVRKDGTEEPPIVTLGDDLDGARTLLATHPDGYSATDAIAWLRGKTTDA
jgi:NAD(P)H-dependent flavin oxidoreductase YrpB (nitropropane dioxygenase family)